MFHGGTITAKKLELYGVPKIPSEIPDLGKLTLSSPNGEVSLTSGSPVGNLIPRSSSITVEVKDLGLDQNEGTWTIKVKKQDVDLSLGRMSDIFILMEYIVTL